MNTPKTPDYGEPWKMEAYNSPLGESGDFEGVIEIRTRDEIRRAEACNPDDEDGDAFKRIVACVNACAGMADPAAEIEAMRNELNTLRWIPITERLPTIEDGNEFEDVEWSDGRDIWHGNYTNPHTHSATHWRRITLP